MNDDTKLLEAVRIGRTAVNIKFLTAVGYGHLDIARKEKDNLDKIDAAITAYESAQREEAGMVEVDYCLLKELSEQECNYANYGTINPGECNETDMCITEKCPQCAAKSMLQTAQDKPDSEGKG